MLLLCSARKLNSTSYSKAPWGGGSGGWPLAVIYCNLATETYPSTPQWLVCPASVSHRLGPGYINKMQRASFYLLFSKDMLGSKDGRTELKNIKHAFRFLSKS